MSSGTGPGGAGQAGGTAQAESTAQAGKLGWYLARLRKMSAQEVAWRTEDQARKWAWSLLQVHPDGAATSHAARRLLKRTTSPKLAGNPAFTATLPDGAVHAVPETARAQVTAAAEEIMQGRWEVLGALRTDMASPDWFLDPTTSRRAPQGEYCFKVDFRDEKVTGNIKQVWELSRMHHLSVLAAAYAFTGDERYSERAGAHLRSWWEANPFLSGVHWTSGIEVGIRLISWAWARRLLEGWAGAAALFEENPLARQQIWWHQRFLAGFRSRGSSANNHVIAEAAGQLVASLAFDWFAESKRWASSSAELLEAELANNTFPSGVNREMAFEYHGLVAELGILAGVEADFAGRPLSPSTWALLRQMVEVVAATVDARLGAPRYGDGDDGRGLVLCPGANRWESLIAFGRARLGPADWWPDARSDALAGLLSEMAHDHGSTTPAPARPSHFSDAGLTLLRSRPGEMPEIWCRADAGPQGFLSIAAHGHADALSVELRHDGTEILADPGTYCYHGEPKWRAYFRSTLGHNTLEIAGQDQSSAGGPFLWARTANTRLVSLLLDEDGLPVQWTAEHDGYEVLLPAASHRRAVRLDRERGRLVVTDTVQSEGRHPWKLAFHLGPEVEVAAGPVMGQVDLRWAPHGRSGGSATISLPNEGSWRLARGEENPVLGWYSPRFGTKIPATTVLCEGALQPGTTVLETVVQFD